MSKTTPTYIQGPPQRTCGTPVPPQQWEEDFQKQIANFIAQQNASANARGNNNSTQNVYTIPVIMHVIHGGQAVGTFPNLAQGQLNSQVQVLNDDYSGVGYNTSTYPNNAFTTYATNTIVAAASKDGLGRIAIANTGITFCLALKDSLGNILPEPGIDRVNFNTLPAPTGTFTSKDPANAIYNNPTKFQAFIDGYIKPKTIWNCSKYLNLWVTDEQSAVGLLGYATFPPSSTLPGIPGGIGTNTTDGFWAYAAAFGSKVLFPGGTYATGYDLGRTCTHEIGHWVGLRHVWGDGTCLTDYCNDTPPAAAANFVNCPWTYPYNSGTCAGPPSNSPNGEMFFNFMDYSYDCAMFMFTMDQRTRIQTAMANSPYRKNMGLAGLCSVPPPTAAFSVTPSSTLCAGATATITDMSTGSPGAWSYTMTGGSPATSTLQSPAVTYTAPGTYTITLIASNGGGNSTPVSHTVLVNAAPSLTVGVAPSNTICSGSSATLTSSGATTYSLNTGATGSVIVVTPTVTTTYTMTGANGSCTTTKTLQIVVSGSIAVNIAPASTSICPGSTVTLTGSGATTYTWSTGPNTTTISVSPTVTTTYTLSGKTGSCLGTKVATVTVNPLPTVTITASSASICPGNTGTLTATASAPGPWTYTWSTGANTSAITTTIAAAYTATVTNANGCKGTQSFTLGAGTTPTLTATSSPTAICIGKTATLTASGATTYTWSTAATGATTAVTPTINTTYTVTGTNGSGCTSTKTVAVVVNPLPVITITPAGSTVCAGTAASFTASGASTYTWNTGPTTAALSVTPAITTSYTVTATNTLGCVGTKSNTVTVNPAPTVTITANPVSICPGNSSTLTAAASAPGPWTYTWSTGANTSAITSSVPAVYSATVTNANGCKGLSSFTLGTSPSLSLTASASPTAVCSGNSTTLSVSGATSYTWSTGATTSSTPVTPSVTTTYSVLGVSGSCTGTTSIAVSVSANPTVNAVSSTPSVCAGNSATLTASGATSYSWNAGPTTPTFVVSPAVSTTYTVTGTTSGCSASSTVAVSANPNPTLSATASASMICAGQTATLNASGATSYTWSTGANTASTTDSPSVTTTYTVTGANGAGCTGTDTVTQVVSACTGIQQIDQAAAYQFGIFPNPTTGEFVVTLGKLTDDTSIEVYNNLGQLVVQDQLRLMNTRLSLNWEADGIYHVMIRQNGQLVFKTKMLKSK
ncbi:MAG: PKD domain-containing protein [Bacteroidia bacterium]